MESNLVLYSDWERHTEIFRKLEQAFRYSEIKQRVEPIANRILDRYGFKSKLLPSLSTGVQGDYRTYEFALMISPKSLDKVYYTATIKGKTFRKWRPNLKKRLALLSTNLTNDIPEINRILFDMTPNVDYNYFIDDYFLEK